MADITSEQLQSISIAAVEGFLNDRVPLSQGIAKQASLHDLNSEQIQRTIEASNGICYLKLLKVAEDRTFEFPLAKYAEVLTSMVTPDLTKVASHFPETSVMEKVASAAQPEVSSPYASMGRTEQYTLLTKLASENVRATNTARDTLYMVEYELQKTAAAFNKDPKASEKLQVIGSFEKTAGLLDLVGQTAGSCIFKEADLKVARRVTELQKQAEYWNAELDKREELCRKAELVKVAFLGAMLGTASKALGYAIGKPVSMVAGSVGRGLKRSVVSGMDSLTPKAMQTSAQTARMSMPKKMGIVGAAGAVGMAGFDASMYTPGENSNVYHQIKNSGPY